MIYLSTPNDIESDENQVTKSFDEAGQGLRDQEDSRRMEEAGDFDSNPAVSIIVLWFSCLCRRRYVILTHSLRSSPQ